MSYFHLCRNVRAHVKWRQCLGKYSPYAVPSSGWTPVSVSWLTNGQWSMPYSTYKHIGTPTGSLRCRSLKCHHMWHQHSLGGSAGRDMQGAHFPYRYSTCRSQVRSDMIIRHSLNVGVCSISMPLMLTGGGAGCFWRMWWSCISAFVCVDFHGITGFLGLALGHCIKDP